MALYYGKIPLSVRIDIDGDFTDELDERVENDEELFDVFAEHILSYTNDGTASYDVEYDGDGSFSFSSRVEMAFDYGSTPGTWNDETGGDPPDGWCEMDENGFSEKKIAAAISSELPDYLKGRNVKVFADFDDSGVELDPEPWNPW